MSSGQKNLISIIAALTIASVLVLGLGLDLFGWVYEPSNTANLSESTTATATVTRVIDGDTFKAQIGSTTESVRLIGIDAPEITWPNDENQLAEPEEECFGWTAQDELKHHVADKQVQLVGDELQSAYDDYGRRLAYVYIGDMLVNKVLLDGGFAREMSVGPGYEMREEFRQTEDRAKASSTGLWAACAQ